MCQRRHRSNRFVDRSGAVRFAEAPRRYQVPVCVRLRHGDEVHERQATVVLEKRGITRIDPGMTPDAVTPEGRLDEPRAERR